MFPKSSISNCVTNYLPKLNLSGEMFEYHLSIPSHLRDELGLSPEYELPDLNDDFGDVPEPPKQKSAPKKRKGNKSSFID